MDTILAERSNLSEYDAIMEKIFDIFQKYFLFFLMIDRNFILCCILRSYLAFYRVIC